LGPRVAEGLSDEELEFYSRQIVLPHIGYDGQERLRTTRVLVAGMGGLGSVAATQLAAMGVGHLRLVDYDVVEASNLQRQHLYDVSKIGYPKVEVAAGRLGKLNPYVSVEPLPVAIGTHNAEELVAGMDVVVDGLDRMAPRYALNRACVRLGVPYVFAGAVSTHGNVSTILPGETACLECFQGSIEDDDAPSCAVLGVHPSILGLIASVEVYEATHVLLNRRPKLAGKLFYCDLESFDFVTVKLSRVDECPVCGSRPRPSTEVSKRRLVTELCARQGRRTFAIWPPEDLALDVEQIYELVASRGYEVRARGRLGITFTWGSERLASLLTSGIMIVEDARDEQQAFDLYGSLVEQGLGISRQTRGNDKNVTDPA
jgi:molybdopterin/thiamine biosynthesis adenylyltransferase